MKEPTMQQINDRFKYTPFLEKHSDFHNLYYDKDLEAIRKDVKHLSDILKNMILRYDRHETLQIAKSTFDYITQREMYAVYPNMYYDFRFGDTRICIGQKRKNNKKKYFVSCVGYKPSWKFNKLITELGYGEFEDIEEAKKLMFGIVDDFLQPKLESLF